ncbi:KEOPS complex subunit Pcc1 [Haloparvum sp. PAK95]|uniref:KEOPS complex subunit Pcc1 n=1 Tax=Haloparvum sp. PAK95 TaxID=3418962 RepID=UPI003D2F4A62
MTGQDHSGDSEALRTATVRTTHEDADLVLAALAPDNTDSMDSRVDGDTVETTIERTATGGLRSTVDDYVVNLAVADRVIARGRDHRSAQHDTNT